MDLATVLNPTTPLQGVLQPLTTWLADGNCLEAHLAKNVTTCAHLDPHLAKKEMLTLHLKIQNCTNMHQLCVHCNRRDREKEPSRTQPPVMRTDGSAKMPVPTTRLKT